MFALTDGEKRTLLQIARDSIEDYLLGHETKRKLELTAVLEEKCGAFVTLKNEGRLRGCIGQVLSDMPLYKTVEDVAVSAAVRDPRFSPLKKDELSSINLEISVLSPVHTISDVSEIRVGEHGIIVRQLMNQGLLLPQVAVEYNWNREEFLQHTCVKAGLPEDAWKDSSTEVQIFSAVVFGEE